MNHQFTRTHPFCCSPVEGFYRYLYITCIYSTIAAVAAAACLLL